MGWLESRLRSGDLLIAPGAYDALSARAIAGHGFEAFYCGGYAGVASSWGLPDLGLMGFAEMHSLYRRIRPASPLPMIVDGDTGYGGPLNVARTVTELGAIGVTAVQIEDQVNPKRCGHVGDKEVVSAREAELRVRVAVDAAREHDVAVIARTDALAQHGMNAALDRVNRFAELGAVATLVDAPRNGEEIATIARETRGPAVFNAATTGLTPPPPAARLAELGFAMAIYPIELLAAATAAVHAALSDLATRGHLQETPRAGFAEMNASLGLPEMVAWERAVSLAPTDGAALPLRP